MAKKRLGKKSKKKGIDTRDWISFVGYFIFIIIIVVQFSGSSKNKKKINELEKTLAKVKAETSKTKKGLKSYTKELKLWRAKLESSKGTLKREKTE